MEKFIDYNSYSTSKTYSTRVQYLVLHYTAANFQSSVSTLTQSVSAHYLIPYPSDPTYIKAGFKDLRIFRMVHEDDKAWHAGISFWRNRVESVSKESYTGSDLNVNSIGIELVNEARDLPDGSIDFPDFDDQQIDALIILCKNIMLRYRLILPENVLAHSDISFSRKSDPGPKFPWKKLYDNGIGAWYDEATKEAFQNDKNAPSKEKALEMLKSFGYATFLVNSENSYKKLIRAVQMHYRPSNYDGVLDKETYAIIQALAEKY